MSRPNDHHIDQAKMKHLCCVWYFQTVNKNGNSEQTCNKFTKRQREMTSWRTESNSSFGLIMFFLFLQLLPGLFFFFKCNFAFALQAFVFQRPPPQWDLSLHMGVFTNAVQMKSPPPSPLPLPCFTNSFFFSSLFLFSALSLDWFNCTTVSHPSLLQQMSAILKQDPEPEVVHQTLGYFTCLIQCLAAVRETAIGDRWHRSTFRASGWMRNVCKMTLKVLSLKISLLVRCDLPLKLRHL